MTTKQENNLGCGKVVAIIAVIASLITIFTFLTGILSIKNLIHPSQEPQNSYQPINTVDNSNNSISEPATLTVPTLQDMSKGSVRLVITSGNAPVPNIEMYFQHAEKDIAGKWTASGLGIGNASDSNGVIEETLDVGTYALRNGRRDQNFGGSWGIVGSDESGHDVDMLILSINPGTVTNISVRLAALNVGLLSTIDGSALKGIAVIIDCQTVDIAGKKIASERCETNDLTSGAGLASFNLGPGAYIVKIIDDQNNYLVVDDNLILQAGETRQVIYKVNR